MDVMGDNRNFVATSSPPPPSNPFSLLVASSADVAGELNGRLLPGRRLAFSNGGDELTMTSTGTAFDPIHGYGMSIADVISGGIIAFHSSAASPATAGVGGGHSLGASRSSPATLVCVNDANLTDTQVYIGQSDPGAPSMFFDGNPQNLSPQIPTFVCISQTDTAFCVLFGDDNVTINTGNGGAVINGGGGTQGSTQFNLPGGYLGLVAAFIPDGTQVCIVAFDGSDTRLVNYTVDDLTLLAPTWTLQSDDLVLAGTGSGPTDVQITSDGLAIVVGCPDLAASGPYGLGGAVVLTRANTAAVWTSHCILRPNAVASGSTGGFGGTIGMDDGGFLLVIGEPGANSGQGKAWGITGGLGALGGGTIDITAVGFELTHSHGAGARYGISVAVNEFGTAVAVHTSDLVNKVDVWV